MLLTTTEEENGHCQKQSENVKFHPLPQDKTTGWKKKTSFQLDCKYPASFYKKEISPIQCISPPFLKNSSHIKSFRTFIFASALAANQLFVLVKRSSEENCTRFKHAVQFMWESTYVCLIFLFIFLLPWPIWPNWNGFIYIQNEMKSYNTLAWPFTLGLIWNHCAQRNSANGHLFMHC